MYARNSFANEQKERITGLTFFSRYIVTGKFTTSEDPHRIRYYFIFEMMMMMMIMMRNSVKSEQIRFLSHLFCIILGRVIYCSLLRERQRLVRIYCLNPYPTAFPYGNGMVLHFYQQQKSSTTKTVHKVINKGLKAYVYSLHTGENFH